MYQTLSVGDTPYRSLDTQGTRVPNFTISYESRESSMGEVELEEIDEERYKLEPVNRPPLDVENIRTKLREVRAELLDLLSIETKDLGDEVSDEVREHENRLLELSQLLEAHAQEMNGRK